MVRLLAFSVLLSAALISEPVRAELQLPADSVYSIVEQVIAKHGGHSRLRRLDAIPNNPREHYAWRVGQFVVGYYTDWPWPYPVQQ